MPPKKNKPSGQGPEEEKELTPRQKLFVQEYLIDLSPQNAAIRAGYSDHRPDSYGQQLLANIGVRREIERLLGERFKNLAIARERVLREYEAIAFSRMKTFVKVEHGRVRVVDTSELPDGADAAVQAYSETITENGGSLSVKLHDKLRALDSLAKYLKIFKDDDESGTTKDKSDLERIRRNVTSDLRATLLELRKQGKS